MATALPRTVAVVRWSMNIASGSNPRSASRLRETRGNNPLRARDHAAARKVIIVPDDAVRLAVFCAQFRHGSILKIRFYAGGRGNARSEWRSARCA